MPETKLYLCEKPDQGRIIAKALGGGARAQGGIAGAGWIVTWGFGHLLTPYMPEDYNEDLKRWEWGPLPIVPKKFEFKPKDSMSAKQLSAISAHIKKCSEVIISTDADREGELIAYEILNRLKWNGPTSRLWLSDLTIPAVRSALASLRDASHSKPLYWAAAARTYADWIVGMNMSRATTLKLAAPGAKPMSVGRVQTPVLGMIVDLERKITTFKPETYYEIAAHVAAKSGTLIMRHAPPPEKRIKDAKTAQQLRDRVDGASGPLSVKTEAKRQAPPPLPDLNALQQECNSRFSWSADHSLKVLQGLYESHQIVTYPRTDSTALPEDHKTNIPTIAANLSALSDLQHLSADMAAAQPRDSVYNDAKVTAHHAIIPTNKAPSPATLSSDECRLYMLIARFWIAAHMPDMQYLQTSVSMDAGGVPLKASGRQITDPGWRRAFQSPAGDEVDAADDAQSAADGAGDADANAGTNAGGNAPLPDLTDGETGRVRKADLETKTTKPPARFNEKSLLQAMKNIAAYVEDADAKARLKETSGIGTPATRANVIETLKTRDYIRVKKRQIQPTDKGFVLIDAMRATAPAYADPVMTAQWEDVLGVISAGGNSGLPKRFIEGIAKSVREDVDKVRQSNIATMSAREKPASAQKSYPKGRIEGDWKAAIAAGTALKVSFDEKEKAKELGARWDSERRSWVVPAGFDRQPFIDAGWLAGV